MTNTMNLGHGVRIVKTVKKGRYTIITTGTNHKTFTRVIGRRQVIRQGQHTSRQIGN